MKTRILFSLIAALALSSCGDKDSAAATAPASEAAHPHSRLLRPISGKEHAVDVAAARALKPGDEVIVRGRLIGAGDVFAEQQAMFIIGDPALVKPNYAKPKPHMACCTPAEIKAAHTLTAQVAGDDGLPLTGTLKGLGGIKELDYVILQGTISPDSTEQAPLLNITALEKVQPWLDGDAPTPGAPTCCE